MLCVNEILILQFFSLELVWSGKDNRQQRIPNNEQRI